MKIEYVANDGKRFKNKQDCIDYESEIISGTLLITECKAFDCNQNKVTSVHYLDHIYYIGFSSIQALKHFNEVSDEFGVEGIESYSEELPLTFYYDGEENCFIQYCDKIQELNKEINELDKQHQQLLFY